MPFEGFYFGFNSLIGLIRATGCGKPFVLILLLAMDFCIIKARNKITFLNLINKKCP